jgi:hypothetical protein
MDIDQELFKKLRDEVMRRNARHKDDDEPFDAWQAVVDIGYEWWESQPKDARVHYSEMVAHMKNAYGEIAALLILLGKANYQICNGGVRQYFDNGYATLGAGGYSSDKENIGLHKELARLYGRHFLGLGKKTGVLYILLNDIGERLEKHINDLDECDEESDYDDESLWAFAGDLDDRWYDEALDVEGFTRELINQLFDLQAEKGEPS